MCAFQHQANPNAKDGRGWNGLFFATSSNHSNVVRVLLASGMDCNETDASRYAISPFHMACAEGHERIVELFLQYVSQSLNFPSQFPKRRFFACWKWGFQIKIGAKSIFCGRGLFWKMKSSYDLCIISHSVGIAENVLCVWILENGDDFDF